MVAILIPTKARGRYLIRQLEYYALMGSKHPIYIGDASGEAEATWFQNEIKRFQGKLEVNYFHTPLNVVETFILLSSKVREKYVCFSGDDDFQIPMGLSKCEEFLEKNQDYVSAKGHGVHYSLSKPVPHHEFYSVDPYPLYEVEEGSAAARIQRYFGSYFCNLFSVIRHQVFDEAVKASQTCTDGSFRDELLPSALTIVSGKSKKLDFLQLVREGFPPDPKLKNVLNEGANWTSKPQWEQSYQIFVNKLSDKIVAIDGLERSASDKLVDEAFKIYIQATMRERPVQSAGWKVRIKRAAPFLVQINKWVRAFRARRLGCSEPVMEWVRRYPEFGPLSKFIETPTAKTH